MGKIIIILVVLAVLVTGGYYLFSGQEEKKESLGPEPPVQPAPEEQPEPEPEVSLPAELILTSSAFEHLGKIPVRYTCDGQSLIPALEISGVVAQAKSLVLIMEDPDVPQSIRQDGMWDHWLKFNLPASLTEIKEGIDPGGVSGLGTSKTLKYVGPCPPDREHRYFFKLYSLDTMLDLKQGATKSQIEQAMSGHILQEAVLIGLYERK